MKKIENKFNFFLACLMAAVAVACLAVYFLAAVWGKGKDPALLAAAFVVAVWAVTDFYDAFHKKPIEERVAGQADERDVYLAMKSSRTAMMIFNKCLILASVAAFWGYAKLDAAFLLPVAVTLAAAVLFLFLLLLGVNLYYEKRS